MCGFNTDTTMEVAEFVPASRNVFEDGLAENSSATETKTFHNSGVLDALSSPMAHGP
jgi:hypothetical protein